MKSNKKKKGILDPFAFKGTEKLNIQFISKLSDYRGTDMIIEPKPSNNFTVLNRVLSHEDFTMDTVDEEFMKLYHEQKLADFLADQFLNQNKTN